MLKKLEMDEIQKISLEVLKFVADICEKENLDYFLAYGTLIGAVRHKGFIPWDDDVDILMPRKDYQRLIKYMIKNKEELKPFQLFNADTHKDYPYMISRISNTDYPIVVDNEKSYGLGIFVDIIPLDGVGSDLAKATKLAKRAKKLSSLYFLSTREKLCRDNTKSAFKMCIKVPAFAFAKLMGKNYFRKKLESLASINDYINSDFVTCVVWSTYGEREIYKKSYFEESVVLSFDKYEFNAPKEYDKVLKRLYGDYMKLPKEEDRKGQHLYSVYSKQ